MTKPKIDFQFFGTLFRQTGCRKIEIPSIETVQMFQRGHRMLRSYRPFAYRLLLSSMSTRYDVSEQRYHQKSHLTSSCGSSYLIEYTATYMYLFHTRSG